MLIFYLKTNIETRDIIVEYFFFIITLKKDYFSFISGSG